MKKFLFIFIFVCNLVYASSLKEAFFSMPLKDRVEIGNFFRFMIQRDQLAHVLFFDTKPAIMTAFSTDNRDFQDKLISTGWSAWKKWEFLFPHPNFIFCEDDADFESWKVVHIFVVNKQTLAKCLRENKDIFQNVLGKTFSPETFISELGRKKQIYPLINRDDTLLGIILGFGRESSLAYTTAPEDKNFDLFACADKMRYRLFPVSFQGNPNSEEVSKLLKKYRDEGRNYLYFSRHKNLLKLALEALTSD